MQRLRLRQLILAAVLLSSVGLYFLFTSSYTPTTLFQPPEKTAHDDEGPDYYTWRTNTSFTLPEGFDAAGARLRDVCRHFPHHKLETIQPVLKTGHGVLERIRPSLRSTSACLDNLLIISDLEEEVDGYHLVDIIADIPAQLMAQDKAAPQLEAYFALKGVQIKGAGALGKTVADTAQGWKTDKFKFLPALHRAWRHAPNMEWYVFYEGDSYIVWDAVFRLLEHYDPNQPHYFGSPAPGRDGKHFAYGGSGYILSRAAIWRMIKADWSWTGKWRGTNKLLEEYWPLLLEDCCGDSVLGWALHQHRIDIEGLWPMFSPHSLQGLPFSDLYWCQPVMGMHRSSHTLEVDLWRWEWGQRAVDPARPVLYRDVARDFFDLASYTEVRENWENGDWDGYDPPENEAHDPHASTEACADACEIAADCFQWNYHLRRCKLVKAIRVGQAKEPGVEKEFEDKEWTEEERKYVAGWRTEKIRKWMDARPCPDVIWPKPSIERIF